jgi:chitinase
VSRALLVLLAVIGVATSGVASSGADFTAKSTSTATIGAAADFNTVTVSLGNVNTPLTGNVPLTATAASSRGIANVKFQYAPSGTTDWVDVCTDTSFSYGCTWGTASIADGSYDVRALATDSAGYSRASVSTARVVDNYTLGVTLADPGAMTGTKTLTATATGAQGGINYLKIQHRAAGATTWIEVCNGNGNGSSSRSCDLNTDALPEGDRELRAVVRDGQGHTAQSTTISRQIDRTPPVTTPSIPPQASGPVTVSAEATDTGSGIASVRFDAFYMGQWVTVCTDTTAPYSCTTDTVGVPDGAYQVRVVTTDNAGVSVTGSTYQIVVDNQTPSGSAIVAGNGSGTAGRIDNGDTLQFTWTEPMAPASILSGWTGAAGQPITVRIRDNASNDEMHFYSGATQLNLVLSATDLKLGGNFVNSNAEFNATMAQSGNSITVTLGTKVSPAGTLPTTNGSTMNWRPSPNATDLAGKASATTNVPETNDRDF